MGLFVGFGVFYGHIKPKILLCYPGFLGLRTKWSELDGVVTMKLNHPLCDSNIAKCCPEWSSSLIKSSLYYCSFQFRCCENQSVAFRKPRHNQPDSFDEALAFLIITLILLFYSEPDLKHLMKVFRAGSQSLMLCNTSNSDECSALFADFDHSCIIFLDVHPSRICFSW